VIVNSKTFPHTWGQGVLPQGQGGHTDLLLYLFWKWLLCELWFQHISYTIDTRHWTFFAGQILANMTTLLQLTMRIKSV